MNPNVLNVEDNLDDILLLQRAWRKANAASSLHVAEHGLVAIDYLSGAGRFADRQRYPLPNVILLDVKMPGKSGLEVLEWIKNSQSLKAIFVAMFTSSINDEDLQNAFRLGANCYLVKPISYDSLVTFVRCLDAALGAGPDSIFTALSNLPESRKPLPGGGLRETTIDGSS